MARRRRDGTFQQRLPLLTGQEKAEKEGYRLGSGGLVSSCPYSGEARPLLAAAWRRGYRKGLVARQTRMTGSEACRA